MDSKNGNLRCGGSNKGNDREARRGGFVRLKAGGVAGLLFSVVALLALAGTARCADQLLNIQFSADFGGPDTPTAQTGAAVIGSSGDVWNLEIGGEATNVSLLNSTGASSGVTFSWTSQFDGALAVNTPGSYGFYGTPDANLMRGYIFAFDGSDRDLTFSGLAADSAYSVYVYTQGDSSGDDRQLTVTANGDTLTAAPSVGSASTFVSGQNYLQLTGTSDSSGNLTLTYNFAAGEADINGLQVSGPTAVPEPSTSLLLGVGAFFGLKAIFRRRKLA